MAVDTTDFRNAELLYMKKMIPQTRPVRNLEYIDGLRAIAAVYVVLHHSVLQNFENGVGSVTGMKAHFLTFFFHGNFAVDLFIVISGFCLMLPVLQADYSFKGGYTWFFKRRIIRILPPYYLAMAFSLVMIWLFTGHKTGTHWDVSIPVTIRTIFFHLLLIHDFFLKDKDLINHSFWSISVECRIYLFFPLLIVFWKKTGPFRTLLLSVLISTLLFVLLYVLNNDIGGLSLVMPGVSPYIILFTSGMLAAYLSVKGSLSGFMSPGKWLLAGIISRICYDILNRYMSAKSGDQAGMYFHFFHQTDDISVGIVCFCLLMACSEPPSGLPSGSPDNLPAGKSAGLTAGAGNLFSLILSWKPLVFTGSFSYSLYLIHAPLIQLITQFVVMPFHLSPFNATILTMLLSVLLIVPVSYVFYLFCERPFMRIGKKLSMKKARQAADALPV